MITAPNFVKVSKLKIFISYSHNDMKYKEQLLSHLKSLELTYNIETWHDGEILAGENVDKEILKQLSLSDIVLLLISHSFMSSYYCIEVELKKAIQRHNNGECIVIPVILSETIIAETSPFANLLRVPRNGRPIQNFKPQNNGYIDALTNIKQLIDTKFINTKKPLVQESTSPITIKLYQQGKEIPYAIDNTTWSAMLTLKDRILDFQNIMNDKLIDQFLEYKKNFSKNKKILTEESLRTSRLNVFKSFLLDICISTREWLFKDVGVRVHFRVLDKSKDCYIGFIVVDGKEKSAGRVNWGKKLTQMSTTNGMIYHSGELNAPLIKSKNECYHEKGKHDDLYVDYITAALKFKAICNKAIPLMSMGISIEKEYNKKFAPYLVALSFYKFDTIVENLIILFCCKVQTIDKNFKLEAFIN